MKIISFSVQNNRFKRLFVPTLLREKMTGWTQPYEINILIPYNQYIIMLYKLFRQLSKFYNVAKPLRYGIFLVLVIKSNAWNMDDRVG